MSKEESWSDVGLSVIKMAVFAGLMLAFFFWGLPAIKSIEWSSPKEGRYSIAAYGDKAVMIDTRTGDTWVFTGASWEHVSDSAVLEQKTFKERFAEEVFKREEEQRRNREAAERRKNGKP